GEWRRGLPRGRGASIVSGGRCPMEPEFSDEQRDKLQSLAASTSFVGVCLMLLAALGVTFALGAAASGLPAAAMGLFAGALLCAITAWWTVSAGRSLAALVATRGKDVEHLMAAVGQLHRLFAFGCVAIVVAALAAAGAAAFLFLK